MILGEYVLHLYCDAVEDEINDCPAEWGQAYRGNNLTQAKKSARLNGWKFGKDISGCDTCYCKHCK